MVRVRIRQTILVLNEDITVAAAFALHALLSSLFIYARFIRKALVRCYIYILYMYRYDGEFMLCAQLHIEDKGDNLNET